MNLINFFKSIFVELVFPRRCPICDKPVKPFGSLACDSCSETIKYVSGAICLKCGKPLEDKNQEYCDDCKRKTHMYDRGRAVFEYKSMADSIYRFKYKGRQEYAAYYGERICACLGDFIRETHAQALVPVPIHSSKLKSRGYNQSELIAKEVSQITGIPMRNDIIMRTKKTIPLKDLGPIQRNNNLRGAFKIACNGVELETIIIIDDIYTTGATIDAISRIFRSLGVRNLYFITLAVGRGL